MNSSSNTERGRGIGKLNDKQGKEKLEAHLKALEDKATDLEEQADYAEKEAEAQKRIKTAKKRIAETRQPIIFLPKISGNRILIGAILLVIVVLLIVNAC